MIFQRSYQDVHWNFYSSDSEEDFDAIWDGITNQQYHERTQQSNQIGFPRHQHVSWDSSDDSESNFDYEGNYGQHRQIHSFRRNYKKIEISYQKREEHISVFKSIPTIQSEWFI